MTYTKQTFEMVAGILAGKDGVDVIDESEREMADRFAACFADHFARSNPRFDRARFLAACGVES